MFDTILKFNTTRVNEVSKPARDWLAQYYQAVINSDLAGAAQAAPVLQPVVAALAYAPGGDYSAQLNNTPASPALPLDMDQLTRPGSRHILLGKTGSGKSTLLYNLFVDRCRAALEIIEAPAVDEEAGLLPALPIYLDMAGPGRNSGLVEKATGQQNLFDTLLADSLKSFQGQPAPDKILEGISYQVLIDNLDLLELPAAPLFFYKFNQWVEQHDTRAALVIGCRPLNFSLYQHWFKIEPGWQILGLFGLDWPEVRASLEPQITAKTLLDLEDTGLTGLFTHPALFKLLKDNLPAAFFEGDLGRFISAALNLIFKGHPEEALPLTGYTPPGVTPKGPPAAGQSAYAELTRSAGLWGSHHTRQQRPPEMKMLPDYTRLGLAEKHPIAGSVQLVDPSLERLVAAWYCLQQEPSRLPEALDRLIDLESEQPPDPAFFRLMYRLSGPGQKPGLFGAILGRNPNQARLTLLLEAGQPDPEFVETLQAYLRTLPASPVEAAHTRTVLHLCAGLAQEAAPELPGSRDRARLAEAALLRLAELEPAGTRLRLELGKLQERLGKPEEALTSYREAAQSSGLDGLEAILAGSRLVAETGQTGQAIEELLAVHSQVQQYQAQFNHRLGVLQRSQSDYEAAVRYARQAVQMSALPLYRHSLALSLFDRGEQAEAEAELAGLLQTDPAYADAYCDLGRMQLARGAGEEALANLRRAVELNPATARYLYDYGRSLLAQGQCEEAANYLRAALAQDEAQPEAWAALGLALLHLNRLEEAGETFEKAIDLAHTSLSAEMLVYLAATRYRRDDFGSAADTLVRASTIGTGSATIMLHLLSALVAEAAHNYEGALRHYREGAVKSGLSLQPSIVLTWQLGLARNLRLMNRLPEADKYWQKAARIQPDAPETSLEAGQLALARQDYEAAVTHFEAGLTALKGAPAPAGRRLNSNWLELFEPATNLQAELAYFQTVALTELGRHDQARELLHRQLSPENLAGLSIRQTAALRHRLGLSLLATGNQAEALPHLQQAVTLAPASARYRLALAQAWLEAGDRAAALAELDQARELEPGRAEDCARLAALQLEARRDELDASLLLSSLNLYLKALATEPRHPHYLYQGALLAYWLQHFNQAGDLLARLHQIEPDSVRAAFLSACNYEGGGQLVEARPAVDRALGLAVPVETGNALVAARIYRQSGAVAEMAALLEPVQPVDQASPALLTLLEAEKGWLAASQQRYEAAAQAYARAIEQHLRWAEKAGPVALEALYLEQVLPDARLAQDQLVAYRLAYARVLNHLQQPEAALAQLDQVHALNPQLVEAYLLRSTLLVGQGHLPEALQALLTATGLEATPELHFETGLLYLRLEQVSQAIAALLQAGVSREISARPDYFPTLGQAYELDRNYKAARTAYTRGLQNTPRDPHLYQALARCYRQDGELLAALQPMQEAVVLAKNDSFYRVELASLYEELGWLHDAASEYQHATRVNAGDAQAWLKTGQLFKRLNKLDQARAALEEALRLDDTQAQAHFELGRLYLEIYEAGLSEQDKLPLELSGMYGAKLNEADGRATRAVG